MDNEQIDKLLEELDANQKENVITVDHVWEQFTKIIKIMEEWVRTKAKEAGTRQYNYIDQKIKSNR